jgi:hypothetical protein
MNNTTFFLCFLLAVIHTEAQEVKSYTIQAGGNILEVVPVSDRYEYPQFQSGIVTFKNGVNSQAKFNYNFIYEAVQFISAKGDTLVISNPENVRLVTIENSTYYYIGQRYVKLDTVIGNAKIGVSGFFATVNKKRLGGYGLRTEGGADSYGAFAVPGANQVNINFAPNVETTVAYRRALFIGDQFNNFLPVTKKNIFAFYPDKEQKLKAFLDKEKINFTSKEDVIRLLEHMEK